MRDANSGAISPVTKDIELPKPSDPDSYQWKSYGLTVPPSRKGVQPHGIRFVLVGHKNAVGFEIRGVELRDLGDVQS